MNKSSSPMLAFPSPLSIIKSCRMNGHDICLPQLLNCYFHSGLLIHLHASTLCYTEQLINLMMVQTFEFQLLCVLIDMAMFGLGAEVNAECHISMTAL